MNKEVPVRVYDLEGHMLKDFPSQTIACKELGLTNSEVSNALGRSISAQCYQFRRIVGKQTPMKLPPVYSYRQDAGIKPVAVGKYWEGRLVCVYNSQAEAAEKNHIRPNKVSESIQTKKPYRGFQFKEIN